MSHRVLLYGATGYSGRLIAAEGERHGMTDANRAAGYRMILGGRHGRELSRLGREHGMEHRVFGLEHPREVARQLADVDVVINAAGPFAMTAVRLAKRALDAGSHYVDINGEAEVYMRLDDLGLYAAQRNLAMVCSCGHTAAASDLLLHAALATIGDSSREARGQRRPELGAVRIAASRPVNLSRGSLETVCRSIREQVRVVRMGDVEGRREHERRTVFWYEPVGKLERSFDFGNYDRKSGPAAVAPAKRPDLRIASAANLVDTLTARLTIDRRGFAVHRIESYVEAGTIARLGYQVGAFLAPFTAMRWTRDLVRLQLNLLPEGPTARDREAEGHAVILDIEDPFQERILDWLWHTPNPYDFTTRVVVETAKRVARSELSGWLTPSEVLQPSKQELTANDGHLRGCRLDERRTGVVRRSDGAVLAGNV